MIDLPMQALTVSPRLERILANRPPIATRNYITHALEVNLITLLQEGEAAGEQVSYE